VERGELDRTRQRKRIILRRRVLQMSGQGAWNEYTQILVLPYHVKMDKPSQLSPSLLCRNK
jgi:hypothetical protein